MKYSDVYNPRKVVVKKEEKNEYPIYFFSNERIRYMYLDTILYQKKKIGLAYVKFLINKRENVTRE